MMFTLRGPAASRITPVRPRGTRRTGEHGARREHGAGRERGSRRTGDPGACREGQPTGGTTPNVRRRTGGVHMMSQSRSSPFAGGWAPLGQPDRALGGDDRTGLVPESLAFGTGRRGARIPGHGANSARRVVGLEAAIVDNDVRVLPALDPLDRRAVKVRVAGPAALLVAKLHKVGERRAAPDRLLDKDALDIYRL